MNPPSLRELSSIVATRANPPPSIISTSMDALKRTRGARKGQLTKLNTAITKSISTNDKMMCRVKLEQLEDVYKELKAVQDSIESQVPDVELDKELDERDTFTELYASLKAQLLNRIDDLTIIMPSTPTINDHQAIKPSQSSEVRLPKLTIPMFTGKIEEFKSFIDLFESTVDNATHISNAQKHYYLSSHVDGDALQLIKSLPLTGENYEEALRTLKDRFDNKNLLISTHLEQIYAIKPLQLKSSKGLKTLLDTAISNVKALANMGYTDEQLWNLSVIHLLCNKLDPETRNLWEQNNAGAEIPTKLEELQAFLKTQITILDVTHPNAKPTNAPKPFKTHTATTNEKVSPCPLCFQGHDRLYFCDAFLKLPVEQRFEKVKSFKLCVNCLRPDHATKECSVAVVCKHCRKRHHTLLHRSDWKSTSSPYTKATSPVAASPTTNHQASTGNTAKPNVTMLTTNLSTNISTAVLPTCYAKLCGKDGNSMIVCVMLDSASDSNYLTARASNYLRLRTITKQFEISGIAGTASVASEFAECTIKSLYSNYTLPFKAPVLPQITSQLPPIYLNPEQRAWLHTQEIEFPVDRFCERVDIDVLLGAQHFFALLTGNRIAVPNSDLFACESRLGWFIAGSYCNAQPPQRLHCNVAVCLEKFWRIEEAPKHVRHLSLEETFAENHFVENTVRTAAGRFQVGLPFKLPATELGDTTAIAKSRLMSMERKMQREPEFERLYHQFMKEYLELGHMSLVCHGIADHGYFLPHHAVLKPSSTTTKLRTVFDGSVAPPTGSSLNKALAVGPPLQPEIFSSLLRFRMFVVAIVADIEKMYRQILIDPAHTCHQYILWRFDRKQPISTYRLNTVTYGTSPASFLAVRCLMQLADEFESSAANAAAALRENFLMDDFIGGADTIEAAIELQEELRHVLSSAGLHLRKWNSNEPAALVNIPASDRATQDCVEFKSDNDLQSKTLGIRWDIRNDCFIFSYPELQHHEKLTKRVILSDLSKFFDPLGLCSPIITAAKRFLQSLWALQLDWDEEITVETHKSTLEAYNEIVNHLSQLDSIKIPRAVVPTAVEHCKLNLHGFCDASAEAYAAVLYVQHESECRLLCAKTKVAPTQTISIPRLELCAAQLLARLAISAATDLKLQSVTLWSDSSVVLNWLQRLPRSLNTFVANRVAEIQNLTNNCRWKHIPTDLNPADIPTRPISAEQLRDSHLWWHGPDFLSLPQHEWPPSIIDFVPDLPEVKARAEVTTLCTVQPAAPALPDRSIFLRYSSLRKLLNVSAYMYRFLYNCQIPLAKLSGPLTPQEIDAAKLCLTKTVQKVEFSETYQRLKTNQPLTKKHQLYRLTPFLDADEVIRVRGRLSNSHLPYGAKHPLIIPANHPFTELIIRHTHFKYHHAGPTLLLNMVRQEFWIVNGARIRVRQITSKCATCIRYGSNNARPPIMGEVPRERTVATYAFETTGLDYAGPFTVRLKRDLTETTMQVHVAVFICMTVKAIHLELVDDLTTASFIAALRRFTSRRGTPRKILSDNATTFTKAAEDLRRMYEFLHTHAAEISSALTNEGISWSFIPPHAPHMGGMWEAAVKSMKFHLKRAIGRQILSYIEFQTLLTQIEMCLNSRPLTTVSVDALDEPPLTPSHFLTLRPPLVIPDDNTRQTTPIYRRWAHVQNLLLQFWGKWSVDYLNTLQTRTKWRENGPAFQIDDLVIIKEDNAPPSCWNVGRIIQLHPGRDGNIRVVDILTKASTIRRPVVKLIPLVQAGNIE